jgi:hypothetical protein
MADRPAGAIYGVRLRKLLPGLHLLHDHRRRGVVRARLRATRNAAR